jgi:Bacterial Ig-like domain
MDGTTITMATFTVTGPGLTPVLGAVSYDSLHNIAIFTPTNPLPDSATFSATLTTGVMSAAEVPLASNFVWTFVASADLDTTAPTVLSTIPAALAPSVATNQKITATFSEPMDSTTVTATTFTLTGPGLTPVAGAVTYSTIGATATFTPTIALATGVTYTATITTGAADLAGVPFALDFAWTFTTGLGPDATAPSITLDTPTNGDSGVALNAGINATFSKAMDPATLDATTFTLAGPGPTPIDGKITYDVTNQIATFSPRSDLATGTTYTATVTTGAKDLEGNPLAADASWSFTTGSSPGLLPVDLGAASPFAIFAQATITNGGSQRSTEISV